MSAIDKTHFVIHRNNFMIIPNDLINKTEISFKAKGIMAYLLSKPDNWKLYIKDLINHSKDGRDSIYAGLKELKNAGFLKLEIVRNLYGQIDQYVYHVYSTSQNPAEQVIEDKQETVYPQTEKPLMENPDEDIPETYNIDISNTEVSKKEVKKKERSAYAPHACVNDDFLFENKTTKKSEIIYNEKFEYTTGVFLSDYELTKLEEKFGEAIVDKMIDRYQEYKIKNNKKYADDYIVLARWLEKDRQFKRSSLNSKR